MPRAAISCRRPTAFTSLTIAFACGSTQRPASVHAGVLSQCDNLLLMRMNSEADLGYLSDTFSYVSPSLIQRATTFGLGETLVAGKFFPHAGYVKFGARISQEGGADIPTAWADPA